MENQPKKMPWYRITGIAGDETKTTTTVGGQSSALAHLIIVSVLAYVLLFIGLFLISAFIYDVYEGGKYIIAIIAFAFGIRSYRKTLERNKKVN